MSGPIKPSGTLHVRGKIKMKILFGLVTVTVYNIGVTDKSIEGCLVGVGSGDRLVSPTPDPCQD